MANRSITKKSPKTKPQNLNTLNDLINLNLSTLEQVIEGTVDYKSAALIFTGSRTAISGLKLGVEVIKLGINKIGDVEMLSGKEVPKIE